MRTDEELRDGGWSESEVRDYRRGFESAVQEVPSSLPPERPAPEPFVPQGARVTARGERGAWQRTTVAGQLATVARPDPPDEAAREREAAKAFQDQHEFTYGRRPSMREAVLAVGRRSDGVVLSGPVAEIAQTFRHAGIPFTILNTVEPLPQGEAVTTQPVRRG